MLTQERLQEIHGWLRQKISIEEAETHYANLENDMVELLGTTGGWLSFFRKDMLSQMQEKDELWVYDSGPNSWESLSGEKGIALVRNNKVINFIMEIRN